MIVTVAGTLGATVAAIHKVVKASVKLARDAQKAAESAAEVIKLVKK